MIFQWDNTKNELNIAKHRIDFDAAIVVFFEFHVILKTSTTHDETRELAVGLLEEREITIVHTWRGNDIRIISARRARKNEREIYHRLKT